MQYVYKSPVGRFWIEPQDDGWALGIDGERLGFYQTAEMAADDVTSHATGWYLWDARPISLSEPQDLTQWQKVRVRE